MNHFTLLAIAIAFLVLGPISSIATAESKKPKDKEPTGFLAEVPGKPGPHLEKIKALGDNEWLNLGTPAADPKWGVACTRSYTPRMPAAPDIRAAFLCGEGPHGLVKPDGHYMDDLWMYDINGHRWVCLYPGADTRTLKATTDQDGFEHDNDGNMIPIAQLVHGFSITGYDPDLKQFAFKVWATGYWHDSLGQARPYVPKTDWNYVPANAIIWRFDLATGKWQNKKTSGPIPSGLRDTEVMTYLPSLKKYLLLGNSTANLYDQKTAEWTMSTPSGPGWNDYTIVSCYDSKRDRVYIGTTNASGGFPVTYDVKTNAWLEAKTQGVPASGSAGCNRCCASNMSYDTVNDVAVVTDYQLDGDVKFGENAGVYVYDIEKASWTTKAVTKIPWIGPGVCANSFYDPDLNVHYFYVGGDGREGGCMWVYRYKKANQKMK